VTNGVQPLGAVIAKQEIYDTFMAAGGPDYMLEFPHGYTYSAHPVACAAGIWRRSICWRRKTPWAVCRRWRRISKRRCTV
jgi:adenosylmethionine-8-amino-7-oxononanoate aminotransferase